MKRFGKILAVALSFVMLSTSAVTYFAAETSEAVQANVTVINVSSDSIKQSGARAIQTALNTARDNASEGNIYKVVVESGTYSLSSGESSLRIYSNTYLSLTGVTLNRSGSSSSNLIRSGDVDTKNTGVTGYAYKNITVDGGVLNGGGASSTLIKIAHAQNVVFKNVEAYNINNGHLFEAAGVNGLTISGCKFHDQYLDTNSSSAGYEAVQLDVLTEAHFPTYRCEDLPMTNVLVENCSFSKCPRGVGSHTSILNNPFDTVVIKNCTFTDMTSAAIQGMGWVNCDISGNTIKNTPRGIAVYSIMGEDAQGSYPASRLAAEGNTTAHVSDSYIAPSTSKKIVIKDNNLTKCGYVKDVYADYEYGGIFACGYNVTKVYSKSSFDNSRGLPVGNYYIGGIEITDNTIESKGHGIRLTGSKGAKVSDNKVALSASTVDSGTNYHGIYLIGADASSITDNEITNAPVNGIYAYLGSYIADLSDNTISGAKKYGIGFDNESCAKTVSDNIISKPSLNGIFVFKSAKATDKIFGNKITDAGKYGIAVDNAAANTITSNTITGAATNGIHITNSAGVTGSISANIVKNSGKHGVTVENSSKVGSISGNNIDKSTTNGIQIYNKATVSGDITGNTVTNSGNHGISVTGTSKVGTIKSNTVTGYGNKKINVSSDSAATVGNNNDPVSATSVKLNKSSITLGVGESYTLTKTVSPSNATTSYSWSSSSASVAAVNSSGKITAKATGTATITVKTSNGKTAACKVTVKKAPTSVSLNKTSVTLGVGETYDLNSKLPNGCASYSVTYSSNNTSVATVKSSGGLVTAKAVGTATITAKTFNGKTATCTVTVRKAPTSVSLNKTSVTLGVGEIYDLNSKLPSGCASYSVTYSSNKTSVATVKSSGGLVTAKSVGTATITAKTYNGKTATCKVTVKKTPTSISLNKTSVTLKVGQTYDLNSKLPSGCASYSVKYTSNNTKVATVKSSGGLVTAKAKGTATITATTYNGKKATCKVTVK